ncbi:MAG: hypothetical protein JRJ08_03405, partial [Deltaproteobacteria bacterium]|nr:hypothetical protein [Deltaproteobacteria bacterium]
MRIRIIAFVLLILGSSIFEKSANGQENLFPLLVGAKWVYEYSYSEDVECEFASSTSENEPGVIYLEIISEDSDVYLVKKTIKSDDGLVSTSYTRLFKDSGGLKEWPSGKIIIHYRQSSWSNYTYLFAESGSDNKSFLSGPASVSVPSGNYSADKVSMTYHHEPEVYFPAPVIIDISSSEFYADGVGLVKSEWEKTIDNQAPPVCEYAYNTTIELKKEVPDGEDVYEPDNSFNEASVINLISETQSHTFHTSSDADYVKLNVQGDKEYYLETSNLKNGADTEIILYDTDGVTILADDDDSGGGRASRIRYFFPTAGTYFAAIREKNGSGSGGYDISVREVSSELYFPH